jgi:hypothetical protein
MFINKGKERALSLTGSIIVTAVMSPVQIKDIYPRIKVPDTFTGDRKKFKAYEA